MNRLLSQLAVGSRHCAAWQLLTAEVCSVQHESMLALQQETVWVQRCWLVQLEDVAWPVAESESRVQSLLVRVAHVVGCFQLIVP